MTDRLVVFAPSGKTGRFADGTTVLDAARRLGVDLDSLCGGRGMCGRCQVEVASGVLAKHGIDSASDHLTPFNAVEARYAGRPFGFAPPRRLGCQARLCGDVAIDVPESSQVHRQVVRKRAESHAIAIDPTVRLYYVEVAEPDMHDPSSDFRRLAEAVERQWEVVGLRAPLPVLRDLQRTLRAGQWRVTAAVHRSGALVALWPGLHERALGLAVDIGSTTIAAHLCDLATGDVLASAGVMNPQIRFGDDLMSRVSFVMMNPGGDRDLTLAVRSALQGLAADVTAKAGCLPADILDVTVVGNPIMHHLLLGLDPTELGGAPFALTLDGAYEGPAADLGITAAPGAFVYVLPCIAGHVGADTAGMVLAEAPYLGEELRLLVDVGTNAEIVLGNRHRLLAASSPTGPAFEGAQICCGQRAAPGAIERVRIDRATLDPRFKVIGSDLWSDEPGFADAVRTIGVTGICGSGIIEVVAEMYLSGLVSADGVIDGNLQARTNRVEESGRTFSYRLHDEDNKIAIYQSDIRAIQLAKAALYAGVKLLMERYGAFQVDRITLAGAFGTHIDPIYAAVLGLVPDCDLAKVASAGNAAGTGARIALLDARSRPEIERIVRDIEKVETAIEPNFQTHFVNAMAFPNKVDAFPHLARTMALPARPEGGDAGAGGRRRRRAGC